MCPLPRWNGVKLSISIDLYRKICMCMLKSCQTLSLDVVVVWDTNVDYVAIVCLSMTMSNLSCCRLVSLDREFWRPNTIPEIGFNLITKAFKVFRVHYSEQ